MAAPATRPALPARRRTAWFLAAAGVGAAIVLAPLDIPWRAQAVLAIMALSMVLWVSEALPLAATALLASLLLLLIPGMEPAQVFSSYFDPVVVLLFGGFLLGLALQKHGLDRALAGLVLRRVGGRPSSVLLAVMATTAVFSMWISNTAATAIMLPIALGIAASSRDESGNASGNGNGTRCLVLGVAFSANVGGTATPIGTTANPIVLRFLQDAGHDVSFLGWMARTFPVMVAAVLLCWVVLLRVFPPSREHFAPSAEAPGFDGRQWAVVGVFGLTVALWLTTDLHGLGAATVAVVAAVLLFASVLLDETDIGRAGWPTLLLVGGGLALGTAVTTTGLDALFAQAIQGFLAAPRPLVALLAVGAAALVMTLFSSNTAAAVVMVPIAIQLATGWGMDAVPVAMLAAVMLSMDFLVPVGTPPNAMAYSTGHVSVLQMAQAGVWASMGGLLLVTGAAWAMW